MTIVRCHSSSITHTHNQDQIRSLLSWTFAKYLKKNWFKPMQHNVLVCHFWLFLSFFFFPYSFPPRRFSLPLSPSTPLQHTHNTMCWITFVTLPDPESNWLKITTKYHKCWNVILVPLVISNHFQMFEHFHDEFLGITHLGWSHTAVLIRWTKNIFQWVRPFKIFMNRITKTKKEFGPKNVHPAHCNTTTTTTSTLGPLKFFCLVQTWAKFNTSGAKSSYRQFSEIVAMNGRRFFSLRTTVYQNPPLMATITENNYWKLSRRFRNDF